MCRTRYGTQGGAQGRRAIWWALGVVLAVEAALLYQLQGPKARDAAAPLEEFSAERAVAVLQRVLGDQTPHPAGSAENGRVRDRLVAELRALGMDVEIQRSSRPVSGAYDLCNILARLPDSPRRGRPLVLATHYDSVAAGPGAADAGSCVAALVETARALQHGGPLQRPVYLLISDGEEAGLKGAIAFVEEHALARAAQPFVLNFDARGTSGPSLMYETHRGNLTTVRWMSHCLPQPCFTGSAFVTVYRYLPNDSDFSVYCRSGWTGLNFAFIGEAQHYHTAQDTLENLDWRSVQHHGENALALARVIAGSEDIELLAANEDAVFFDVLGGFVAYFPESWAWPLAAATCVVLVACGVWKLGSRSGARTLVLTLLAILVGASLSAALGWGLTRGLSAAGLLPRIHVAHGRWIAALYWPLALGVLWFVGRGVLRRTARDEVWAAFWLIWSFAALAVALRLPGFCHMLLVPALAAALLSLVPANFGFGVKLVAAVGVASVMLLPLGNMLPIVFGPGAGLLLCPVCAVVLSPLLPGLTPSPDRRASTIIEDNSKSGLAAPATTG